MDRNYNVSFGLTINADRVGFIMEIGKEKTYITVNSVITKAGQKVTSITGVGRAHSELNDRRKKGVDK